MMEMILAVAAISSGSVLLIQFINMLLFSVYMRGDHQPGDESSHLIGTIIYNTGIYTMSFSLFLAIYLIFLEKKVLGVIILIFGCMIAFPLTDILIDFVVFLQKRVWKPSHKPVYIKFTKTTKRFMLLEELGISVYSIYIYDYIMIPSSLFLVLSSIGLILTIISLKKLFY